MTYTYCKKVIVNIKMQQDTDKYLQLKEDMQIKLDVFLLNDRITQEQYNELTGMLTA